MPPPTYNFASLPAVSDRSPLKTDSGLAVQLARGTGYLGFVRDGRLETLGVDLMSGRIEQIVRLPASTFLPLISALATGLFFVSVLLKFYLLALVGVGAAVVTFLLWTRSSGDTADRGLVSAGRGEQAIFSTESADAPSAWAMSLALAADAAAYASLAFGLLFLSVVAPNWPPPNMPRLDIVTSALILAGLVIAAFAGWRAGRPQILASASSRELYLAATAIGHAVAFGALLFAMLSIPDVTRHAYAATALALLGYVALHCGVGLVFSLYGIWRSRSGYVSPTRALDISIAAPWHGYTALTGIAALALLVALPWAIAP
jgi:cytochrome c oxidase subunit I+III